jgi:hypothetical protein
MNEDENGQKNFGYCTAFGKFVKLVRREDGRGDCFHG